ECVRASAPIVPVSYQFLEHDRRTDFDLSTAARIRGDHPRRSAATDRGRGRAASNIRGARRLAWLRRRFLIFILASVSMLRCNDNPAALVDFADCGCEEEPVKAKIISG